jgi:hypothetical protein
LKALAFVFAITAIIEVVVAVMLGASYQGIACIPTFVLLAVTAYLGLVRK